MEIWKPLAEFLKPRGEVGYHADFALKGGEHLSVRFGDGIILERTCPEGVVWKCHFELAVESFREEAGVPEVDVDRADGGGV